jgi:hypothetical protein
MSETGVRKSLTEAQRRALGQRLGAMERILTQLEAAGVTAEALSPLRRELGRLSDETGAIPPAPPPHELRGMAASLVVGAGELGPRRMSGYGPVGDELGAYLDAASQLLQDLALALVQEVEAEEGRRGGARRAP